MSTCSNNSEVSNSGLPSQSVPVLTSGIESIQFGLERDLNKQFKRESRATLSDEEAFGGSVIFSDSGSNKHSNDPNKAQDEAKTPKTTRSMFRKPGEESGSPDDVEEIPRVAINEASDVDDIVINEDLILFIKMTPYPLTLDAFIVSKTFTWNCE